MKRAAGYVIDLFKTRENYDKCGFSHDEVNYMTKYVCTE